MQMVLHPQQTKEGKHGRGVKLLDIDTKLTAYHTHAFAALPIEYCQKDTTKLYLVGILNITCTNCSGNSVRRKEES
jgi:hypothetical protein